MLSDFIVFSSSLEKINNIVPPFLFVFIYFICLFFFIFRLGWSFAFSMGFELAILDLFPCIFFPFIFLFPKFFSCSIKYENMPNDLKFHLKITK